MLKQFYRLWEIKSKSAMSVKDQLMSARAAPNADISAALTLENSTARSASLKSSLITRIMQALANN